MKFYKVTGARAILGAGSIVALTQAQVRAHARALRYLDDDEIPKAAGKALGARRLLEICPSAATCEGWPFGSGEVFGVCKHIAVKDPAEHDGDDGFTPHIDEVENPAAAEQERKAKAAALRAEAAAIERELGE